jgi:hemerythrin
MGIVTIAVGAAMEKLPWSEEYETGIKIIDKQHRALFRSLDGFTLAIYDGEGKEKLKQLMWFLDDYVNEHFDTEEKLMLSNNYPEYDVHVRAHEQFATLFKNIKKDFQDRGGDTYLAIRLEKEIRVWWENHILVMDKKYVPYIGTRH